MDRAEELAEKHLQLLGYAPVFEPNGKSTFPDFEVSQDVAVEVRSLNEHDFSSKRVKGLREESQPLYDRMEKIFRSFDSQYAGETYFVIIDFQRPLPAPKEIKKSVQQVLSDFLLTPQSRGSFRITEVLSVEFVRGSPVEGNTFLFGAAHDRDAGGWVVSNFIKNLNHCISDKTVKQQNCKDQYSKWRLILADEIARGFSEQERETVLSAVEKPDNWDRVIVLNNLTGKEILDF